MNQKFGEKWPKKTAKIEPKSLEKTEQMPKTWPQNWGRKMGPFSGPSLLFQSLFRKGNTNSDPKKPQFRDPDSGARNWSKK